MIEFAPTTANMITYDEAVLYCFFCNYNGHTDWRLPTEYEYSEYLTGSFCWDIADANYIDPLGRVAYRIAIPVRTL